MISPSFIVTYVCPAVRIVPSCSSPSITPCSTPPSPSPSSSIISTSTPTKPIVSTRRRARKPRGYWTEETNVLAELRLYLHSHEHQQNYTTATAATIVPATTRMPTISQLRRAGRNDLIKAISQHGGFAQIASRLNLSCARRSRFYTCTTEYREETLKEIENLVHVLHERGHIPLGYMPTSSVLRRLGYIDMHNRIIALGGFISIAKQLSLLSPCDYSNHNQNEQFKRRRRRKTEKHQHHYWFCWRTVEYELRQFAKEICNGYMPLQRQLIKHGRSDLLNGIRHHGGLSTVARRAGLQPTPEIVSKRPRGYWKDVTVLHGELLTFTARYGHPGLMPRRDQLLRFGRSDLAYAIERHGGFCLVASNLHLVWHGPSSFWRVFKNLQKRLLSFIKTTRTLKENELPNIQTLYRLKRLDLIYGIAIHGGVMKVAKRMNMKVHYKQRDHQFWTSASNVQRELQGVLQTQPLESRRYMPSSVALTQLGRIDLATGIRDHGGWIYYAQKLGLRFSFEEKPQGFWQRESNVVFELNNYINERYGDWEHPGKQPSSSEQQQNVRYIPSVEMLTRDGRSDIAFAICRFHGGMNEFASRHGFVVACDIVECKPAEELQTWSKYIVSLQRWIEFHGSIGMMPTKEELILTGRYDLRYATYYHGGFYKVSRHMQLVYSGGCVEQWLPIWLGIQAGKLGTVLNLYSKEKQKQKPLNPVEKALVQKMEYVLNGSGVGRVRHLINGNQVLVRGKEQPRLMRRRSATANMKGKKKLASVFGASRLLQRAKRRQLERNVKEEKEEEMEEDEGKRRTKTSEEVLVAKTQRLTRDQLEQLCRKYSHLPSDNLICTQVFEL